MSITILASHDPIASLAQRLNPATTIAFDDRVDLAARLIARSAVTDHVLDLVGITGADHLVTFHGRPLDTAVGRVRAFWREIADQRTLERLGITRLRLVGCLSSIGTRPRATLAMLHEILQIEVVGTTELVTLSDLGPTGYVGGAHPSGGHFLDLDALPARAADESARVTSAEMGREVLAMIRRNRGTVMPGLLALPLASLAIPSAVDGLFHHLELLLDYELVRTGNMVFFVDDPRALRRLLEA